MDLRKLGTRLAALEEKTPENVAPVCVVWNGDNPSADDELRMKQARETGGQIVVCHWGKVPSKAAQS